MKLTRYAGGAEFLKQARVRRWSTKRPRTA